MQRTGNVQRLCGVAMVLTAAQAATAEVPVARTFTYQGRLKQSGAPVNGPVDLTITLWDDAGTGNPPTGGVQLGTPQFLPAVQITDGLFTVVLNAASQFGPLFNGNARWLQIDVNGTVLAPRQPILPTPYALAVPGIDGFSLDAADGSPVDAVYVDNSGRVGIGTTTPLVPLHLKATKAAFRLEEPVASAKQWELGAEGNSRLLLRERTTNRQFLRFEQNGNVSIGDVPPDEGLNVAGTSYFASNVGINVRPKQGLALEVNGASTFTGNVGIGTNPLTPLHVKGTARVGIMEITGGADIAEPFEIRSDSVIRPGMVVSIDPDHAGELQLATKAYDPAVAGVISGANGVNAGLLLKQEGSAADGKHPVALTGRVWCRCDADAGGPILPGNLLTTSSTPGHAMKAGDAARARGATLGKAMSRLEKGKGLVLVLVNLQ